MRDPAAAVRALHAATGHRLEVRHGRYLEAMARHGTTTVEVKTGCGFDEGAEAKLLRMLAALRRDPIDVIPSFLFRLPSELKGGSAHATEWVVADLLPKIRRRGVAQFADLAWDCDPALLPVLRSLSEGGARARLRLQDPCGWTEPCRRHRSRRTARRGEYRSFGACHRMPGPAARRSGHHDHAPAQRVLQRDGPEAPARAP